MVYKNYISGKKLSGLDIYICIFLFAFIITAGCFIITIIFSLVFFWIMET